MNRKDDWRKRARANRDGMSIDHGRVVAGIKHFLETRQPENGRNMAVTYWARPGEPDLSGLVPLNPPWTLALTRTPPRSADNDRALTVHRYDSELEAHPFGYQQPTAESPVLPDSTIGVVLVPGLAFSMNGARLGHGAGYYDRFLARLGPEVIRIGVTDGFIVSDLPTDAHDVPMTHLAGETGVFALGDGRD